MDVEYLRMAAFLETIWAIGWSMIALSLLIRLPERALLVVGMLIVFGHNALDSFSVPQWLPGKPIPSFAQNVWMMLHQSGFFPIDLGREGPLPGPIVFASYPILAWIGVMTLGYCFARVFTWSSEERVAHLRKVSFGMLTLFFALRFVNVYGDPVRWKSGATFAQTVYSFFNVQKYPPSLDFILATLGPCLLVLALIDRWPLNSTVAKWFMTFGRAPMFFFLVQWPYVHLAGIVVALSLGQPLTAFTANLVDFVFGPQPASTGGPLWMVYVAWILGALVLYFPVRWYAALKARRRDIALLRFI